MATTEGLYRNIRKRNLGKKSSKGLKEGEGPRTVGWEEGFLSRKRIQPTGHLKQKTHDRAKKKGNEGGRGVRGGVENRTRAYRKEASGSTPVPTTRGVQKKKHEKRGTAVKGCGTSLPGAEKEEA